MHTITKMQEKNKIQVKCKVHYKGEKIANYFKVIAFSTFYINMEMRQTIMLYTKTYIIITDRNKSVA